MCVCVVDICVYVVECVCGFSSVLCVVVEYLCGWIWF